MIILKKNPITNYLDLCIDKDLNYMSIRSCLVSQPSNKSFSNNEQIFNAMELSPMTSSIMLSLNVQGKIRLILKLN